MTDDLTQLVTQMAPTVGTGGALGMIFSLVASLRLFARPQDVELAKAQLQAEMAEKYLKKEEIEPMRKDISYIRQRIDQIADHK